MHDPTLPPGQYDYGAFPRFGMTPFAYRFPRDPQHVTLTISGNVEQPLTLRDELATLPRVNLVADFHCVTTWSRRALHWSGYRFADFYTRLLAPQARPLTKATFVVLRCQDGYRTSLPLADLLAPDVLLADRLDDLPLTIEHGAPLRLVAPAHYGYKNAKHLAGIELWRDDHAYRPAGLRFMEHPRARVAYEERGRGLPGWLLRYVYRPLVRPTVRRFQRALAAAPMP